MMDAVKAYDPDRIRLAPDTKIDVIRRHFVGANEETVEYRMARDSRTGHSYGMMMATLVAEAWVLGWPHLLVRPSEVAACRTQRTIVYPGGDIDPVVVDVWTSTSESHPFHSVGRTAPGLYSIKFTPPNEQFIERFFHYVDMHVNSLTEMFLSVVDDRPVPQPLWLSDEAWSEVAWAYAAMPHPGGFLPEQERRHTFYKKLAGYHNRDLIVAILRAAGPYGSAAITASDPEVIG